MMYQVKGFDDVVFHEEACMAYGIDPEAIPFELYAAYPWDVAHIKPCMVYAFHWELVEDAAILETAKASKQPLISVGSLMFLGTPRIAPLGNLQEVA